MVLEWDDLLSHLLHLQCLVELMLLYQVLLPWMTFSFMTRPRVLPRYLLFIFSPNMTHLGYLLTIECVWFITISLILLQRFCRYRWRVFHARSLRFILVSVHNLNLSIRAIHKWNALSYMILFWFTPELVGHCNNLILLIFIFLCSPSPSLIL